MKKNSIIDLGVNSWLGGIIQTRRATGPVDPSSWLLASGVWSDSGVWDDAASWNDGV